MPSDLTWIPPAERGGLTHLVVVICDVELEEGRWPGWHSGTIPVWSTTLATGHTAWLVSKVEPMPAQVSECIKRYRASLDEESDFKGLRLREIIGGERSDDGTKIHIEVALDVP